MVGNGIRKRRVLSDKERNEVVRLLLHHATGNKLPKNTFKNVAAVYGCGFNVIKKIWYKLRPHPSAQVDHAVSVDMKKKKACGRKAKFTPETFAERLKKIKLRDRGTFRDRAFQFGMIAMKINLTSFLLDVSISTLHSYLKKGMMKRHSSSVKSLLTSANKYARLKFALGFIEPNMEMMDMDEIIHLDEKWFNLRFENEKYYLAPDEPVPQRHCKSKRFTTKVMFLACLARPRVLPDGTWFDGKVGMFPFVEKFPALRGSRNRPAGTLVTNCVNVTKDVYRETLIKRVLPRIMDVWPTFTTRKRIVLQHDNAPAHVPWNDERIVAAFLELKTSGWDFAIAAQPPNSPDTNVLDLGFFASIQSLQYKHSPQTIDQLIHCVELEFGKYSSAKLGKIWQSLQLVLLEIVKAKGGNEFKLPHASKDKMAGCGKLLDNAQCDRAAYEEAIAHLVTEDALVMEAMLNKEIMNLRAENELIDLLESTALSDPEVDDIQVDALCVAAGMLLVEM